MNLILFCDVTNLYIIGWYVPFFEFEVPRNVLIKKYEKDILLNKWKYFFPNFSNGIINFILSLLKYPTLNLKSYPKRCKQCLLWQLNIIYHIKSHFICKGSLHLKIKIIVLTDQILTALKENTGLWDISKIINLGSQDIFQRGQT